MSDSGWIRSIRKKLGLKSFQLAELMQVSAARISVLERDENRGAVTLKMMQKAAHAMNCKFEYRIVPLTPESKERTSAYEKPRYRAVAK